MARISPMSRDNKKAKGVKMATLDVKVKSEKKLKLPYMTNHFIERYFERVLKSNIPKIINDKIRKFIYKDFKRRLQSYEEITLKIFASSKEVQKVSFAKVKTVIVKKNTLITVY